VIGRRFYKMTGSGNDFIMLDGRAHAPASWTVERIVAVCDRRRGVGADGLVILAPVDGGVRMHFWNRDGSVGAMCGNAALCSTVLATRLGLGDAEGMWLETGAGRFRTRKVGPGWSAELNLPAFDLPLPVPEILLEAGERSASVATVGVEHLVVMVDDADAVPIEVRGPALRRHPALGPQGANANFISPPAAGTDGAWRIRTWERGVEGETLACGTGTVAAAVAVAQAGQGSLPLRFRTIGGPLLSVSASLEEDRATGVWLAGEGRLVFEGQFPPDGP